MQRQAPFCEDGVNLVCQQTLLRLSSHQKKSSGPAAIRKLRVARLVAELLLLRNGSNQRPIAPQVPGQCNDNAGVSRRRGNNREQYAFCPNRRTIRADLLVYRVT